MSEEPDELTTAMCGSKTRREQKCASTGLFSHQRQSPRPLSLQIVSFLERVLKASRCSPHAQCDNWGVTFRNNRKIGPEFENNYFIARNKTYNQQNHSK